MSLKYCEECGDLFFEEDLLKSGFKLICKNCANPLHRFRSTTNEEEED